VIAHATRKELLSRLLSTPRPFGGILGAQQEGVHMDRLADAARRRLVRFVALIGVAAVTAIAPAAARGGLFFSGTLTFNTPFGGCYSDWGNKGCAQSGFAFWNAVILTKYTGERVALGMRGNDGIFRYFTYGATANGHTYALTQSDLGAPDYNRGFCAWYSGNASSVDSTASV
jgi:hypothetical protein